MAQSPIVVVATDNLDRSITIAMNDSSRVEYFLGDRYLWIERKIKDWIRDEWYNYAVAQLTKYAVSIEMQRPELPRIPAEPVPWAKVDYISTELRTMAHIIHGGTVTGRLYSDPVSHWLEEREKLKSLYEIGQGIYNATNCNQEEENEMARRSSVDNGKFSNLPSAEYRFTVIAPQAQTFHYHQQRRWYKSRTDAEENLATVLEDRNTPSNLELAVVELVDIFKRKPKVELVSTLKNNTRSRR